MIFPSGVVIDVFIRINFRIKLGKFPFNISFSTAISLSSGLTDFIFSKNALPVRAFAKRDGK